MKQGHEAPQITVTPLVSAGTLAPCAGLTGPGTGKLKPVQGLVES